MPIRYVLVGDTSSNVEHDDSALAIDVITISQPAEFFLACCVPDIELDASVVLGLPFISESVRGRCVASVTYCCKGERMNLNT